MNRLSLLSLGLLALLLSACPPTGIVCRPGTVRCGDGCIDPAADKLNCGACGIACASVQVCFNATCQCQADTQLCDGACVVTASDARHCGSTATEPCGHACALGGLCAGGTCGCPAGLTVCSNQCVSTVNDAQNCGTCGHACASGEVCDQSTCTLSCTAPAVACGSSCATLASDRLNCGTCGHACGAAQSCVASACVCPAGQTLCGPDCVDLTSAAAHCGACDVACQSGQSCRSGRCTYDVVAACSSSGQVVGVQAGSEVRGPREPLGTGPAALAAYDDALLAADGLDRRLYQANLRGPANLLAGYQAYNRIGAVANQVLVDKPYVYVVNAETGTLQVLQQGVVPDAGAGSLDAGLPGGLVLATVAELNLGANTYPEGMAKVGAALWIPLYGGYTPTTATAGQKVVRVSVANPLSPTVTDTVDLATLDLHAFPGATPLPRPAAIAVHQGMVYVALNNLDATYTVAGPGLLARIDPTTKQASVVNLGATRCLDPQWLASDGQHLVVSCMGRATYDVNYALVGTELSGLVLVANDAPVANWAPAACAALPDGGAGCPATLPGRFALAGGRVYLGDQNGGRVYVLDVSATGFGERRGYAGDAGVPVAACPVDAVTGYGNVSDVLAVP